MSTEEKILALLEEHSKMFEKLNGQIDQMRADMNQMQTTQEKIQTDIGEMQKTATRVAVTQENIVIPQIKLLAEGHDLLLDKLAHKDRVEALEDDVAMLKTVIKAMSQRITELEKAQ